MKIDDRRHGAVAAQQLGALGSMAVGVQADLHPGLGHGTPASRNERVLERSCELTLLRAAGQADSAWCVAAYRWAMSSSDSGLRDS